MLGDAGSHHLLVRTSQHQHQHSNWHLVVDGSQRFKKNKGLYFLHNYQRLKKKLIDQSASAWVLSLVSIGTGALLAHISCICEAHIETLEVCLKAIVEIFESFVCQICSLQFLEFCHIKPMGGILIGNS